METKFEVGGVWEEAAWRIVYGYEVDRPWSDQVRCPHCADTPSGWMVPRVVVATNESGFNSTGVCLDCILDAAKTL